MKVVNQIYREGGKLKKKPNYSLKAKAMKEGYCEVAKEISLANYRLGQAQLEEALTGKQVPYHVLNRWEQAKEIEEQLEDNELYEEAIKVNKASQARRKRLSKRIGNWLKNYDCIFLTLTFRDDVLEATSEDTRRRYVTRALKKMSNRYVANIDYGEKNEREHYHAVVVSTKVDNELWPYGLINFKKIHGCNSEIRLAKYITKITNHALKETAKGAKVIYSKM